MVETTYIIKHFCRIFQPIKISFNMILWRRGSCTTLATLIFISTLHFSFWHSQFTCWDHIHNQIAIQSSKWIELQCHFSCYGAIYSIYQFYANINGFYVSFRCSNWIMWFLGEEGNWCSEKKEVIIRLGKWYRGLKNMRVCRLTSAMWFVSL